MTGKKGKFGITVFLAVWMMVVQCLTVSATQEEEQPATGPDWAMDMATAPAVVSESAILMDIDTSVILYEKNIHKRQYPASITKLLTCLVAAENSELTDIVTFSHEAVYGIEPGSSSIGIDEGEQLTMEECYYAALLASANEVSSGIAEHVGGSVEGFAAMMNEKVKELGGTDSNFVNANGLHDDNHYTSAYDMALIGQAFARNETLLKISGTPYYYIEPTPMQPDEDVHLRNHHKMLPGCQLGGARPCEYVIGGKTGFTTVSQNTLVTFAKKDGHRLVCVVLRGKKASYFEDTLALINYGFDCYEDTAVRAQIDAKIAEMQAQEAEEEAKAEEEARAQQQSGQEEMAGLMDHIGVGEEGELQDAGDEKGDQPQTKKSGGVPVLTIVVIIVVLAAATVCGLIFYRSYKQEQERRRRRAEIMARHRARREANDW